MLRKKLKVEAGKTYTVRDAAATYTIIVGDVNESDSASASPTASDSSFAVGVGAPSLSLGRTGGVYLDSVGRKIYTKDAIGWDAGFDMGGSSSGLNGSNGRTTLEGSGPTTDSVVYAAALSDAGITASDVQNGDLYLDTLNHIFYKRVSGAWVSRSSHKGLRGRTIFEGSGDPDDETSELPSDISDAAEGDLYHDVVNFKWHRRNSSGIPGDRWTARSAYLGSIGPIGPNGLGGLDGSKGSDGRTTIEGAGPPTNATVYAAALADAGVEAAGVKNGDLYLDTLNHVFYKRTSGSWVSRTSHVGRNGKTIFDGSGDPDDPSSELPSDIGDAGVGDLYHDVTNFKWYKRNSSGIPGERWDPRNSYKPGELKNISLATSFNLATAASSEWLSDSALAAVKENDTVLDPNNKRMYKRTSTGWEDQGSIAGGKGDKGDGGDNGQDGRDGVSAQLTNDSDVISADSDGSGYDFADTGGEFEIRTGGTKVSSGVTYYAGASGTSSTSTVNGLTLTINSSGVYALSGASWTRNFARFTMRADYGGVTYIKVYKVTKALAGLIGSNGQDGLNGSSGLPGNNGKDGSDGTNGKKVVTSSALSLSGSPVGATSYGCEVGDTLIDTVNHKVYTRASSSTWTLNGSSFKGAAGESSLIGQLTKEVAVIPANSSGIVTAENLTALGGGYFKVYSGKTDVTSACTFSIPGGELSGNNYIAYIDELQLNLNKATGQFSLSCATWNADSTSFTMQATYSGSTVTKIYNVTKSKTGPGIRVYSVALGSDSSTSDVQLTTSYKDMYLADVITNESNILTAVSSKSATTFTINESGRYKIELQAAFRVKNVTKGSTYSAICSAQILKNGDTPTGWNSSTSSLSATLAASAIASAAYASSAITISKTVFLAAGTTLKMQAKTSTTSGGTSYLELATDSETQSAEDTILTITKL